jgi:nickel transport protein
MFLRNAILFRSIRAGRADTAAPGCQPVQRSAGSSLAPALAPALPLSAPLAALLLAVALLLVLQTPALAHRVNIFAWTEGPQVAVKCGFSGGNSVRNGEITVYDAADGQVLLTGQTDTEGLFRFDIPPKGREHGLRIRINAGEGHQNEWLLDAAELASAPAAASAAPRHAETSASAAAKSTGGPGAGPLPASTGLPAAAPKVSASGPVSAAEIQAIVDAALEAQEAKFSALLDSRLSPVKRQLAEMRTDEPGMREIVGGIGWFVGLAGLALYFRSRRR